MENLNTHSELNAKDYFNILRRRTGTALLFFVTTVLVVTLGSFMMKPVYRAKTAIMIDLENPNVLTSSGMVEIQSQNYYSYKEYYQSQKEILTSLPIIQKVFDEFGLGTAKEYQNAKEPVKKFAKTISVQPVRDTRILELYVENRDPELAAKIANRIAEIYVRRNLYYISKTELLNLLKNEYLKLETKLSEYSKIYKEGHPEMIRLKNERDGLISQIEKEKQAGFRQDYTEEEEISYKYALEGLKANNVSVLAAAEVPKVPLKPKKLLNILIAIALGSFGGIGLAFLFEYMDDTVKEALDLERVTKWPFLGSVPKINQGRHLTEFEKDILVHAKPKDPITETYRSIRTSILFSETEEHPLRTIIFTSSAPQEGKTTTLCNLGIAMAQNQRRVLLVDADMRNPRLHKVFKKDNKTGLSSFLIGTGTVRFDSIVQKTDIENLSLVASGVNPPNPAELLTGKKMADFIEEAKKKFDVVLFDTPPITIITDATILSRVTDGVVVVVESGSTPRKILKRVEKILDDARARVIGVVLNKISIHSNDYYYYSHYYSKKL